MSGPVSSFPLSRILILPEVWPRLRLDQARVELFASLYEEGGPDAFPPLELVAGEDGHILAEGRTRLEAALLLGWESLPATFVTPHGADPLSFAFEHALRSCTTSAAPLTAAERKDSALRLMSIHPEYRDGDVSQALGVDRTTVLRWRHEFEGKGADAHPAGRDRELETANDIARRLFKGIDTIHGLGVMNTLIADRTAKRLASLFRESYGDRAAERAAQYRSFLDRAVIELQRGEER